MRITIVTTEAFPVGLAASNRIMSYAKGFIENGCKVTILCMMASEDPEKVYNSDSSGILNGIRYKYTCGTTIRSKHFIIRRFSNLLGILSACLHLLKDRRLSNDDAIIYYSSSTSRALMIYIISRLKKIKFIKEESELPVGYFNDMSWFQKFCFLKIHHILFDGIMVISKKLERYFKEERNLKIPVVIIPMTVDFRRFDIAINDIPKRYIAYCGSLNNEKDGVDILLKAFALLVSEYKDMMLYLIGESASEKEGTMYKTIIADSGLEDKVLITGRVSRDEVPDLLCRASILAMARPGSLQAEGGFPTKLGEYLATGNPVIATKVGEIPEYFTDGKDIFLAEPGNIQSLYEKMKLVLSDYSMAKKIGANGRFAAEKYFNPIVQAQKIINFIKSFSKL